MSRRNCIIPLVVFLILMALPTLLFPPRVEAQPPDTLRTRTWDLGDANEAITALRVVPDGGYVATGYAYIPDQGYRVWTARLDEDLNKTWKNISFFGNPDYLFGDYDIAPTTDGGLIQCGEYWTQFDGSQGFLRKWNADNSIAWTRYYDTGDYEDVLRHVAEVPAGGYIASGYLGTLNITRFSETGDIVWQWPVPGYFSAEWVEPMADGGFLVPHQHYNQGLQDYALALYKVDEGGNLLWVNDDAYEAGQPLKGQLLCSREAADGSLYVCGFTGTVHKDFYVSKRNAGGSIIWATSIDYPPAPNDPSSSAWELSLTVDGNLIVGGYTYDDNFNKFGLLVKVSNEGEVNWASDSVPLEGSNLNSVVQGLDGTYVASLQTYHPVEDLVLVQWEPEVRVDLTPNTTTIPPQGQTLFYEATVSNTLLNSTPFDAWTTITTPTGNTIIYQQIEVILEPGSSNNHPGATIYRPNVPLTIPAAAPPGEYTFEVHVGVAPPAIPPGGSNGSRTMGMGSFQFVKVE